MICPMEVLWMTRIKDGPSGLNLKISEAFAMDVSVAIYWAGSRDDLFIQEVQSGKVEV